MVKGNRILNKLKSEKFCEWMIKYGNKFKINLSDAYLRWADLRDADLHGADLDFSCWPLWCGSKRVKIDERQAKQLLAHAFNAARAFWPDSLTIGQKEWLNDFHRIKSNEFPRFE